MKALGIVCSALALSLMAANTRADDEAAMIEYLKGLAFEELQEIEVSLDDVFDIFDGLIKARSVSVASGVAQSMARAPAVTTVITAQDIEATSARDLDEILASVPGLHVGRDNFYNPIYSVRGLHSLTNPEVLLLVNGIPMRDLTTGNRGVAWGGMPLNNVARIEIIRGPGSAVYGADAFSGVINIITKQAQDIKGSEAGLRLGTQQSYDAWALHGGQWAGMDLAAAVEFYTTAGADEIIDADRQSLLDQSRGTSASHAPGPVQRSQRGIDARIDLSKAHWRLRTGFQGRNDLGLGAGGAQALDPIGRLSEDRYHADLSYDNPNFRPHWQVQAQLSLQDRYFASHKINLFPPGTVQPYPQRPQGVLYEDGVLQWHSFRQRYSRAGVDTRFTGWRNHAVRIGAGYAYEDLYESTYRTNRGLGADLNLLPADAGIVVLDDTPAVIVPEGARQNRYVFLQDSWAFADVWELTAGLRYDHYSDFGNTANPRAALVWRIRPALTAKLLYGQAFRAPSFRELYVYNNAFRGNVELKPESIRTWEMALDWQVNSKLNLAANIFHYQAEDKILFLPIPQTSLLGASNQGSQTGQGAEFEMRWKMSNKSSLLLNYAYARSDNDDGLDIGDYPRQRVYARSDWLLAPNWYLNAQWNWVGQRQRQPGDTRALLRDYHSLDLTLRYKDIRAKRWNLAVGIRNALDRDRRESISSDIPGDLPLAGRSLFGELRYQF
jgi:outer membrane receptor for ferrienterochelin and colicin